MGTMLQPYKRLLDDACLIIDEARHVAFKTINNALTIRNWHIGARIAREELKETRAEYGKGVISQLAVDLTERYGKGFDFSSLYKYVRFYQCFPNILDATSPNSDILDAVSPKLLPWTHYRELIRVDDVEARIWYEQEALREMWSTRTLHRNISSQYYYRLLQSADQQLVKQEMHNLTSSYQQDKLEFIKSPVVAEFLGWQNNTGFTESELEGSIISHLQQFIMEMGKGFAFVARQQHIRTDMGDYYILI